MIYYKWRTRFGSCATIVFISPLMWLYGYGNCIALLLVLQMEFNNRNGELMQWIETNSFFLSMERKAPNRFSFPEGHFIGVFGSHYHR